MSEEKLTCMVIEDEEDTRNWMVNKLTEFPDVQVVGTAAEINNAFELISEKNPDFIFLDVELIGGNAFQLINRLESNEIAVPYIIVATAYQDFIFETFNSYREHVLKFLMKPFVDNWHTQFRVSIDAVIKNKMIAKKIEDESDKPDYIFIQNQGNLIRLSFSKIAYLEVAGKGKSHVILADKKHVVDITLNKFMGMLPDNFFRVSRNNIVNINLIENINKGDRTLSLAHPSGVTTIGISDTYYNDLLLRLGVKR